MEALIDGVTLTEGVLLDPDRALAELVAEVNFEQRMRARLTASYGEPYDYSGQVYEARPMVGVVAKVAETVTASVGFEPNNCLLNLYPDGRSTMGWHSDATDNMQPGTGVVIVSMGAERVLWFRALQDHHCRVGVLLRSGSLLHMTDQFQHRWAHAVRKDGSDSPRASLTFRRLITTAEG